MSVTIEGQPGDVTVPAFDELWATSRLPMRQLAMMLIDSREAAEDVVQDAFVAVYRHWPVTNPSAYLRTCVINGCRSVLRRRRLARLHVPLLSRPEPGADEHVVVRDEHREVLDALAVLPRRQREVLVLKYWTGLPDEQDAAELGVSIGTVTSSATRARAAVGDALKELS